MLSLRRNFSDCSNPADGSDGGNPPEEDKFLDVKLTVGDDDGLTNLQESDNQTNPWDGDTDDDNLNDGYEINTSGTDPKDNDYVNDSICLGNFLANKFYCL